MTNKQKATAIGLAMISIFIAIAYLVVLLALRKKSWFDWFLDELKQSDTAINKGIDNEPTEDIKKNLRELSDKILYPLRKVVVDWQITSGYRCGALNEAVGGVANSQHKEGKVVDFKCSNMPEVFEFIKNNLDFDQLIWEKGTKECPAWIHVSYNKGENRKQVIYSY